jgi:UDP-N-acetylglucosamine--N-acetylmuramyl-(pentapeptide) pyrophosphoryl-undecaprenol N-acetylglucosamine transferase
MAYRLGADRAGPAPLQPIHVLVTGASRGEQFLGAEMPAFLGALQRTGLELRVRHQAGTLTPAALEDEYARQGVRATVMPFLDDMADALQWAHFVVTRAGAATLGELAIAGVPALIVPLSDAAADHQSANAARHAAAGAAVWARESAWDRSSMKAQVHAILTSADRWSAMSAAARRLARPDAARLVVESCEQLMDGRW